jgi:hypothetical protein
MTFFVHMLARTPSYVFLLLAYLVWQGILSLRPRQTPIWRVLIVPAIFTATGLLLLLLRPSSGILAMMAWVAGLAGFVPLGLVSGPRILGVDRQTGRVTRAGSPVPLLRNLLVFASQYAIAVAIVLHPQAQANLTLVGHVVSGTSIGYFLGWTITFWRRYRAATDVAPTG